MFETRAERLLAIANLLTNGAANSADESPISIIEYTTHDDARLPVPHDPSLRSSDLIAHNFMADAMPTSIQRKTAYSVIRQPDGAKIVIDTTVVDLGAKIPVIDFTNHGEDAIEAAADFLAETFSAKRQQTPEQQRESAFNGAIRQTLLGSDQKVIHLSSTTIQKGVLDITHVDLLTGQTLKRQEPTSLPTELGRTTEFDMLSKLQQIAFGWSSTDERRETVQALTTSFKW